MDQLKPEYFFDLSSFSHAGIFNGCIHVWEVLPKIKDYLNEQKLGEIRGQVSSDAYLVNPEQISIGEGTVVEPGAYIKGPCIIGSHCTVRHGAYVRGNLIAGDTCVIGHDTEVKNALFLNEAHAAHFAYVGDSVLGNRVNLGAGTVCANLKLNRGLVAVFADGKRIETGLKKFGAVLGDDAQTGCNAVINPGTLFDKGAWCMPCQNVSGLVSAG